MENTTRPSSVVSCIHLFPLLALQLWQSWYHHNAVCHLSTRQKSVDACKSFTTSHHQSCNQIGAKRFPPNRSTPTRTGHPTPRRERPKRRRRESLTVLLRPNVDVEALQQHRSPSASPPDNSYESFALSNRHKTYRDRFRLLHKQLVLLFFLRGPPSL